MPTLPQMEFHISRQARNRYQFDLSLFSYSGNVVFANFHAARVFAQRINEKRDVIQFPERAVRAGQINAMGLIDEILHLIIDQYRQQVNPRVLSQAMDWMTLNLGDTAVNQALYRFAEEFPPLPVFRGETSLDDFMASGSADNDNKNIILEEMLLLWLANNNPAYSPFLELFDDTLLEQRTVYNQMMASMYDFFATQPSMGPDDLNLIDMLRGPALASPYSLNGQLDYIRTRWGSLIGRQLYRLLTSLDLIAEEEKAVFFGPGPSIPFDFSGLEAEPERFSPDRDWMPNLVLIAKNAYVWLDQLSKKYQLQLTHLDQVPEAELARLSSWGITGLWLIGLWERSPASKHIKQLRGNPEAVASAYSLFSYDIAADLGGEAAYQTLRERAWAHGIRLASDMVPNHMGIDSRWVIEHPDWFITLDHSPFPSYNFNGPDLSWDDRVGLFIEDHYFDNSDAAVVFKRIDYWTGQEKYIYHGNDGTSTPWNDTAQLNYLNPEVREAVIQTILHVARKFPVIRFDAAMTLAKRHFQRLWYPEPGSGGDIASRAENGMTKEQFDSRIPNEFWRDVVDRVAAEAPDTLLLAEAFWLMEGYFVRTLGMHRVYNSAFMNMLRDEKNQEYRLVIKNTLAFDPEILKRYVSFMSNPDERTAVDQFGKGDKYFGICTMLATLPGLPMFGHGQIEGFTEKYGMEYRRAYWEEQPDRYLLERHEREIFPLLRRRYLFSEAENFLLYDFETPEGYVNEDVFSYSNRSGNERALIVFHNRFAHARGVIRTSAGYSVKSGFNERVIVQKSLAEGLGLSATQDTFTIFRDHQTGLEYIRSNLDIWQHGLTIELDAYQFHVFLDFRELQDNEWHEFAQLSAYLNGRGVPSIEGALHELLLEPVYVPFQELVNAELIKQLADNRQALDNNDMELSAMLEAIEHKAIHLLTSIKEHLGSDNELKQIGEGIRQETSLLLALPEYAAFLPRKAKRKYGLAVDYLLAGPKEQSSFIAGGLDVWGALLSWIFIHRLGEVANTANYREVSRAWLDEWMLAKRIAMALQALGLDDQDSNKATEIIKLMTNHQQWSVEHSSQDDAAYKVLQSWLKDPDVQRFLQINRYQDILWYNQGAYHELVWWMFASEVISTGAKQPSTEGIARQIVSLFEIVQYLLKADEKSNYQVDKLLSALINPA
ncbi:MAG: alpha-amylase [Chloroflexi bacterium RBG_16_52_11]|nr:MAG: alpha-amylase [Chloroflexi bacterium RBG_16_52_11]